MKKTKTLSAEQVAHYFQGAKTFSMKEKLYWYKSLLDVLILANEEEKSKDGKRFRYDFERHKIVIANIESLHQQSLQNLEGISRDYSQGVIPILKTYCEQLRAAVLFLINQLFQEYVGNKELFSQENNLLDNPIAGHGDLLQGVRSLPLNEKSELFSTSKNVCTLAAERLYTACSHADREIFDGSLNSIRAAWLCELMLMQSKAVVYVYGAWRFERMVNELSPKDFRYNGQKIEQPNNEKDQKMLSELEAMFGKWWKDQIVGDDAQNACCKDHDHECCHDHQQP